MSSCIHEQYASSDAFVPVVSYDPHQLFAYRSWSGIHASLVHIQSATAITNIMTNAKSFIRKSMPRECFECITLLHQVHQE